jgi:ADP-ribose pyrophosphatase
VILVNQFRYPTLEKGPAWVTEVLAGVLEPNEDPEAAIRREILEEIGYRVGDLMHIATFYMSPGGSSERIILYSAEVDNADKVTSGGGLASEDEDIKILEFSLADLWAAFQSGEIVDAKTIIALMWLRDQKEDKLELAHEVGPLARTTSHLRRFFAWIRGRLLLKSPSRPRLTTLWGRNRGRSTNWWNSLGAS